MIKKILVPTDGSDSAAFGVTSAVELAQSFKAHIQGIYVVDVKLLEGPFLQDLSASLGTAPYVNYQGNISMLLEERGKNALDYLKKACEAAGVPCDVKQTSGVVSRTITEHSGLSDLIVMGRGGEHSEWLEGLIGSTAEAVIRRSTLPVLITGQESLGKERILVAYDGSSHAKNALKTAVFFAEVSELIVETARSLNADLIVMGAYGHSKVRELVVGSTTSYVINHATCPVLLAR